MAAAEIYYDEEEEDELPDVAPEDPDYIWTPEPDAEEDPIVMREAFKRLKKLPRIKPSAFTQFAFMMPTEIGEGDQQTIELRNFSFKERPHLRRIYDTASRRVLLMCARQVEKSTLLGNISLSYSCIVPGYRTLYVSPSATQTKTFSNDRIKEPLETSPVLRQFTTKMLSQNILEKQFVNRSKITLRYAFLNADRCIAGGSRVQLLDGSLWTIRDLTKGSRAGVVTADKHGRPSRAEATQARSTGVREVVSVSTDFPIPLVCTPDHRILTGRGWVEAQHLREGDYVAAPHPGHLLASQTIGEDAPWLIGALVAEGKCVQEDHNGRVITFSNTDEEFILEFEERAARFGLTVGSRVVDERYDRPCYTVSVYSGVQGQAFGGKKKELWELGEFGARSTGKHIPQCIFRAPLVEKAAFLQALFRGDGWCCPEGGYARAGYATSSPRLAEDLVYLLWQLGIRCSLRTKSPSTENAEPSLCLDFSAGETAKLVTLIGEYRAGLTYQSYPKRNHKDRVPVSYQWLRGYLLQTHGLSTHAAWTQHQIQLRPGNRRDSIGRRVLGSIAEKLQDDYLRTLVDPATSWVEVHSVTPAGEEEVFDLTVDPFECFQANGLIVHNCRGIPAWGLLLDEIQDILNDNIPVIEACQNHAPKQWRRNVYSGTPKSLDNTIETYWSTMSTMNEWVVPCEGCKWWNILGEKNIGKKGIICEKCGKGLHAQHVKAQWAAQRQFDDVKVPFEGYRINQLMVPWVDWNEVLISYEKSGRDKFYNEVLGISYDSGMRPLTRAQVRACCNPDMSMMNLGMYKTLSAAQPIFAGIDWGCHDEDTRILTRDGFKYFRDLLDADEVAQWDPDTREMTYTKPKVVTIKDWDQPLLHFKTKGGLDMMLTHTHRMRVGVQQGERWLTESAGELAERGGNVKFVGHVEWKGDFDAAGFILPGLPKSPGYSGCEPVEYNMDDWLEFLGYVLSEGGVCLKRNKAGELVPYCVKMSQRETVSPEKYEKIQACMVRMGLNFRAFPNPKTGDVNWTIYGKQLWSWLARHVGMTGDVKRIPSMIKRYSKRQLRILFDAMLLGDGYVDPRDGCTGGAYYSTSKKLCEDFQELCIKLGLRCVVRLHKPAAGNRKARYRALWSAGRDYTFNTPSTKVKRVPYKGKVYCCSVPTGYIVTERNGCIAYQGNTGEHSYTVLTLATYIDRKFRVFYTHRFVGDEVEPDRQMDLIIELLRYFNVALIGTDYGGGFYPNDKLVRVFGPNKVWKYQYANNPKVAYKWNPQLSRFILHRSEVMSQIFNAIKRRRECEFPKWEEFENPYAQDMLNIFSETNQLTRIIQYKHSVDKPDDTFHSFLYCWLVSMLMIRRTDIIRPNRENAQGIQMPTYSGPTEQG